VSSADAVIHLEAAEFIADMSAVREGVAMKKSEEL